MCTVSSACINSVHVRAVQCKCKYKCNIGIVSSGSVRPVNKFASVKKIRKKIHQVVIYSSHLKN